MGTKGKIHIGKNGPSVCNAELKPCPLPGEHYNTMLEAQQAMEKKYSPFSTKRKTSRHKDVLHSPKPSKIKGFAAISGALVATISLAACNSEDNINKAQNIASSGSSVIQQESQNTHNQDYLNEKIKSASSNLSSKEAQLKSKLKNLEDKYGIGSSQNTHNDTTENNSTSPNNSIMYQGKSLNPTSQELQEAKNELNSLIVKNEDTSQYYNRNEQFGKGFKNGIVGEMEHRDITSGIFSSNSSHSRANGGSFVDPYTGKTVKIIKGNKTDTDIDHVVPLKIAEESGAANWTAEKRRDFANDPNNLAIVSSSANRSKGDRTADQWTPSYDPADCRYVISQIEVYHKYDLSVDNNNKNAMNNIINNRCVVSH